MITRYIFAGNLRVAQVKGNTTYEYSYFHKDHLGSSTVTISSNGAVVESPNYEPFGNMREHTGSTTSNYKFTDQELDGENGLYNYDSRLYDPVIGRFISPDTIVQAPFNPQSLNRYSYCLNNPLIYVDPSGHLNLDAFWDWLSNWFKQSSTQTVTTLGSPSSDPFTLQEIIITAQKTDQNQSQQKDQNQKMNDMQAKGVVWLDSFTRNSNPQSNDEDVMARITEKIGTEYKSPGNDCSAFTCYVLGMKYMQTSAMIAKLPHVKYNSDKWLIVAFGPYGKNGTYHSGVTKNRIFYNMEPASANRSGLWPRIEPLSKYEDHMLTKYGASPVYLEPY